MCPWQNPKLNWHQCLIAVGLNLLSSQILHLNHTKGGKINLHFSISLFSFSFNKPISIFHQYFSQLFSPQHILREMRERNHYLCFPSYSTVIISFPLENCLHPHQKSLSFLHHFLWEGCWSHPNKTRSGSFRDTWSMNFIGLVTAHSEAHGTVCLWFATALIPPCGRESRWTHKSAWGQMYSGSNNVWFLSLG